MTDSDDLLVAYQHGAASNKDRIRELEAALTEARMQSLADQGQAADALEAQKKAEAERDKLSRENDRLREEMGVPYGRRKTDDTSYIPTGETEK